VADLGAERAERVVHHFLGTGAEEHEVAGRSARALEDRPQHVGRQELHDRRLQSFLVRLRRVVDLDVGEALGAVDRDERRVVVDLLPRERAATGSRNAATRPCGRSAAARNTLKSTVRIRSVSSVSLSDTRRSGLSEP
jgi:hypothetical protein